MRETMSIHLNGSAELTINGLVIRADAIDVDEASGKITMTGSPSITPVSDVPFPLDFRPTRP
jgi:hypothetical protein